jgi:hypothetical protein
MARWGRKDPRHERLPTILQCTPWPAVKNCRTYGTDVVARDLLPGTLLARGCRKSSEYSSSHAVVLESPEIVNIRAHPRAASRDWRSRCSVSAWSITSV